MNPNKQGRYLPGSSHRIIAPEALRDLPVTAGILLNPNHRDEVAARLRGLALNIQLLDPMNLRAAAAA